ncbi:MAG TPA: response regulator [Tepidisphaeraceae bacterium]|jgi:DNA-binding response OmpR family regulator
MQAKSLYILLVEDHADSAAALAHILERLGHHVEIANDTASAVRSFVFKHCDLLLIDIKLPDGDGCDLLKELSAIRQVPAIALTGLGKEDIERTKDVGFLQYLQKPVEIEKLKEAINAVQSRITR